MHGSLKQYLLRTGIFLVIIFIFIIFLYPVLQSAFVSNIYINSIIILSLIFGISFCLYNLLSLDENYAVLANFNIHKSPQILKNKKGILKNLIFEIVQKDGRYKFKSSRINRFNFR